MIFYAKSFTQGAKYFYMLVGCAGADASLLTAMIFLRGFYLLNMGDYLLYW